MKQSVIKKILIIWEKYLLETVSRERTWEMIVKKINKIRKKDSWDIKIFLLLSNEIKHKNMPIIENDMFDNAMGEKLMKGIKKIEYIDRLLIRSIF